MNRKIWFLVMTLWLLSVAQPSLAKVNLNEVMPCNISTYMDKELYNFSPYVEFYNDGAATDLKGYTIRHYKKKKTGSYELKWEWDINESIIVPAEGFKLIYFDKVSHAGHAPYKLDSDGGKIILLNKLGEEESSLIYNPMYTHIAHGQEGYMEPTPLKENSTQYADLNKGRCAEPKFAGATPGVQDGPISLSLSTATAGATIYYTTDGTEPTTKSTKYTEALTITGNKCIRAKAFKEGMISSSILTGSFLYVDAKHIDCGGGFTVPIVSIVVDDTYLHDDIVGICTEGTNGAPITSSCLGSGKANFMQDWDRPVNFEYIVDGKQVVTHEAEVAVMGGCSRGADVKSFKIKAGKKTGAGMETLNYSFFADKPENIYESLHLRNGGNAATELQYVRCRDGFMQSIAKKMDIDYQAYQPVAYFINGKYKGLMGLRERTNEDYIESNYGIDEDNIDQLKLTTDGGIEITTGDIEAYNALINFVETQNPASKDYYTKVANMIDMNEYMDYQIFEQFIVNTDWPGNNCKLWRDKNNGRFRWLLFDTDFGLGLYGPYGPNYCDVNTNMLEWCTATGTKVNWANGTAVAGDYAFSDKSVWKTTLFKHLMSNETFKERFLNRMIVHLGSTFSNENITAVWDSFSTVVKDEFCAAFSGASITSTGKSMVSFAKARPEVIYNQLKSYYKLGEITDLTISSNVDDAMFLMNQELLSSSKYIGKYYIGKDLTLETIAPQGYVFSHWAIGEGGAGALLTKSSQWSYFYGETGFNDTKWTQPSFDDSKWATGHGKFGYANNSDSYNTVLDYGPDDSNKYPTAYFRSKINIDDPAEIKEIVMNITYDDAFVVYINGKEVGRKNISGDVTYETMADDFANDYEETITISANSDEFKYLVKGENTIAVEIHQNVAGSSDLTFICSLEAEYIGEAPQSTLTDPILTLQMDEAKEIKAVFKASTTCPTYDILINEICSSNHAESDMMDEYGHHSDWFEVVNTGSETIDLAGLSFANSTITWTIPYGYAETKIQPGEYKVIWADKNPLRGPLHVNFKLSNSAENAEVAIFNACGDAIDFTQYAPMTANTSYGRVNESNEWKIFGSECEQGYVYLPTPMGENGSSTTTCDQTTTDNLSTLASKVAIYPNPATDVLHVSNPDKNELFIYIYDNMGRTLLTITSDAQDIQIPVEKMTDGLYHIHISKDSEVIQNSFLKK